MASELQSPNMFSQMADLPEELVALKREVILGISGIRANGKVIKLWAQTWI